MAHNLPLAHDPQPVPILNPLSTEQETQPLFTAAVSHFTASTVQYVVTEGTCSIQSHDKSLPHSFEDISIHQWDINSVCWKKKTGRQCCYSGVNNTQL